MRNHTLYEKADTGERVFPIHIFRIENCTAGPAFVSHWHEQMEWLYVMSGRALVSINSVEIEAGPGDFIVINSNELHSGYCVEKPLDYYCIIFDSTFVSSSFQGVCEQKYLAPMEKNRVQFQNRIRWDPQIQGDITNIISENGKKENGYELYIKSSVYGILGTLFRKYVSKVLTEKESDRNARTIRKLDKVLTYIGSNLSDPITIDQLAGIAGLSRYRFCHLFRQLTGVSAMAYILGARIDQAELLLKKTDLSVMRIAMDTGFSDSNYFSRMYRKHRGVSPSSARKP